MHLTKQQYREITGLTGAPVYGAYVNDLKKERKNFQWHILSKTKSKLWESKKFTYRGKKPKNSKVIKIS